MLYRLQNQEDAFVENTNSTRLWAPRGAKVLYRLQIQEDVFLGKCNPYSTLRSPRSQSAVVFANSRKRFFFLESATPEKHCNTHDFRKVGS